MTSPDQTGQAGAEIEITPEMINAGVALLSLKGVSSGLWDGGQALAEDLFLAMAEVGGYVAWLAETEVQSEPTA